MVGRESKRMGKIKLLDHSPKERKLRAEDELPE